MVNVTASYSPKHFLLKALSNYQTFAFLTASFCTFGRSWNLSAIYHKESITSTQLYVLQCLFVRVSNKRKRRDRINSNFVKGQTFFILYGNQVLLGVISQCSSLVAHFKEGLPLIFSLAKRRIYLDTQLKRALANLF